MTQTKSPFKIDDKAVRALAVILSDTDLSEIEYECDAGRIRVARQPSVAMAPVQHTAVVAAPAQGIGAAASQDHAAGGTTASATTTDYSKHPGAVKSPMVGTAYLSPQPGAPSYVKEGDTVTEGQVLMIIEAMKVMNPLKAPRAGKIAKIFAQDTTPVEYDEVLIVID